jgi:hypothetical protein
MTFPAAAALDAIIDLVVTVKKRPGPPREQDHRLVAAQDFPTDDPLSRLLRGRLGGLRCLPELGSQLLHLRRGQ